jgi:hypothetical protein
MKTLTPPRYGSPDEVPADYYKQVGDHTDKPIVFAELGWPSDPAFGGSPESQSAFLKRFPALIDGLDVRLVNYNFLHDAKGFGPIFDSMGLIDSEGQPKPALAAFQALGPRSEPGARATGPPPT